MQGNQTIGCSVSSCRYYDRDKCSLASIQVAPCAQATSGKPEDETLCSSYKRM